MPTRVTARVFGPRMLTPAETTALWQKDAQVMLAEELKLTQEVWREMAEDSKKTGRYQRGIRVVEDSVSPHSVSGAVAATADHSEVVEVGRGPVFAKGQALGNLSNPWQNKSGHGDGKTWKGGVFRKWSGKAEGKHYRQRVIAEQQPVMRARVAAAGRKLRNDIVAAMNAKGVYR